MIENLFLLYPPERNSEKDLCSCQKIVSVKLVSLLNYNPIYCRKCNLAVDPEKLNLDVECVASISNWVNIYDSLYNLWLDSNDYENFAFVELKNLNSRVNKIGIIANKLLNKFIKSYYWYQTEEIKTNCLVCENKLEESTIRNHEFLKEYICENCLILFSY